MHLEARLTKTAVNAVSHGDALVAKNGNLGNATGKLRGNTQTHRHRQRLSEKDSA